MLQICIPNDQRATSQANYHIKKTIDRRNTNSGSGITNGSMLGRSDEFCVNTPIMLQYMIQFSI